MSDGKLRVSALEFQAVLLPALTTIRSDTLEKLREFYAAGGTVVAFGRLPDASPEHGRSDPNVRGVVKEVFGVAPGETPCAMSVNENGNGGKAFFFSNDLAQVAASNARRLFLRDRRLLDILPRCAAETITRCWRAVLDRRDENGGTDTVFPPGTGVSW